MLEIILDASQIEVFEKCPYQWYLGYVRNLESKFRKKSFDLGSYYHEVIASFLTLKKDKFQGGDVDICTNAALKFARSVEMYAKFRIEKEEDQKFHWTRLRDYFYKNRADDEVTETIAVEKGFSWLLYQDEHRCYILEGKIDHVAIRQGLGLIVEDHKTQSRKDDRYEYNHQVMNYCAFVEPEYFVYNYIGLQDKLPADGMRREIFKPPPGMVEQWKKDVIRTFDSMYNYLRAQELDSTITFPRQRSACKNQYGLCQFTTICQVPDNSPFVPAVLTHYKEREKKWTAWSKDDGKI